jgi:hypothetical protein
MESSDWVIVGVVAALILLGGFIQFYATFMTDVPENFYMNDTMTRAMDDALEQAPKPGADEFWRVAIVPFKGDSQGKLARAFYEKIRSFENGEKFRGPEPDYVDGELQKDFKASVIVESEVKAAQVGSHLGVDVVAWGKVDALYDQENATEVTFEAAFERMPVAGIQARPEVIGQFKVERKLSKSIFSLDYVRLRLGQTSSLFRIILWILVAAGLPFLLYPVEMKVFEFESNGANFTVLIGLVLLTLLAALLLNGFAFSATWAVLYVGILVAAGAYNLALLNAFQEGD